VVPPGLELAGLRGLRVLVLEQLGPVVPAPHLPEVDHPRPVAGRARLLPGADERRATPPARPAPGVRLVGLGAGTHDVDDLVQVEVRVRHALPCHGGGGVGQAPAVEMPAWSILPPSMVMRSASRATAIRSLSA